MGTQEPESSHDFGGDIIPTFVLILLLLIALRASGAMWVLLQAIMRPAWICLALS